MYSYSELQKYLPYYLTSDRQKGLIQALKDVPSRSYYSTLNDPEPLQGDGWRGLQLLRFEDGFRTNILGLVLTNSCDLASDNARLTLPNLNFVPLVSLDNYLAILAKSGKSEQRIKQHASDIRDQKISDLFYLPPLSIGSPEYIAVLNNVHTMPLASFNNNADRARSFSLSDTGFYFFIFKLAVHFCRLHENIDRSGT